MGTVFKRTATKPLPMGAELFSRKGQRFARWTTAKGKMRTAAVVVPAGGKFAGQERIVVETPTYTAKFRDGAGYVQTVATGCKDETAARAVLAELEKRAATGQSVAAELTVPLAKVGGLVLLVKGQKADEELKEASGAIGLLGARHAGTVQTPTGRVVVLEKASRTPREYPRRAGMPKQKPLSGG